MNEDDMQKEMNFYRALKRVERYKARRQTQRALLGVLLIAIVVTAAAFIHQNI